MTPTTNAAAPRMSRVMMILIALEILLVAACVLRVFVGNESFGWPQGPNANDILYARIFRLGLALTVGAALAVAGVGLQALLRNPLAEPFILGLSTGAAAGILVESALFFQLGISFGLYQGGAVLGAGICMSIVFLAGRRHGVIDPLGLLLAGVVLSTINGAVIMMCSYMIGPGGLRDDLVRWMMGYLNENVHNNTLFTVVGVTVVGVIVLFVLSRAMDIASLSETEARSLGVHLTRLRVILFVIASVLTAGAVALAGPIAFVGLISPHLGRVLLGPKHGPLIAGSAMIGATLIVLADVLSAAVDLTFGIGMMPIGIFTALVGGPAFLWMLRPQLGRGEG